MASRTPSGIPIIDISSIASQGQLHTHDAVVKQLAQHLPTNGSVALTGHGISTQLLEQAFETAKALFNLPYEEKMKAPHPAAVAPHRGYSGVGTEIVSKNLAEDAEDNTSEDSGDKTEFKETYEMGSEENKIDYNIWLPESTLPGFRAITTNLFWTLHELSDKILDALMLSLEFTEKEKKSVKALYTGHNDVLRMAHYLPVENTKEGGSRLGAHTDWTLFTLLFQDGNSGLEFQDRETGGFQAATPQEGVVYMNIGDMFMRISNGLYPSALHRVVTTEGATLERFSIPYFILPERDGIIEPVPSTVEKVGKKMYETITYGEYYTTQFEKIRMNAEP